MEVYTMHHCNRDCRRHGCPFARTLMDGRSAIVPEAEPVLTDSIALFYLDQNQSGSTPYEVLRTQAMAMKAAGRGKFINHGRAFQLCESAPLRQTFSCSASPDSSASISVSEIQANVGITSNNTSPNEPPMRHVVLRAQQKVQAIGRHMIGTFDPKAPLAFGSWCWPRPIAPPAQP